MIKNSNNPKSDSLIKEENVFFTQIIKQDKINDLVCSFQNLVKLPFTITNTTGQIIIKMNWQNVCTQFHHKNKKTRHNCIFENCSLFSNLKENRVQCCLNNLYEASVPIFFNERVFGYITIGQFFFKDKAIDYSIFSSQAKKYGFDEKAYLEAIHKIPKKSEEEISDIVQFATKLASVIGDLSFQNLEYNKLLKNENIMIEQLKQSKLKNDALLKATPDMMFLFDKEGTFLDYNAPHADDLATSPAHFIGKNVAEILPENIVKITMDNIEEVQATKKTAFYEYSLMINGIEKHFDARMVHCGEHFLAIVRDITERKKNQEREKLLQQQLQQAQKLEAIGTLTGGIAHDFNNILTPIMGYADMIKMFLPKDSHFLEDINEIIAGSHRAKDLINQLLTFSRKKKTAVSSLNVVPIIKEAVKFLQSSFPASISINLRTNKKSINILGNATQLHQIMMNLCINAQHALEKEDGTLKNGEIGISLKQKTLTEEDCSINVNLHAGQYLELIVADNGKGIPQHIISRIFDPFFTTKKEGKGTGMGLAVIHGIIKAWNGTIQVFSEVDKGTSFVLYIPLSGQEISSNPTTNNVILSGKGKHVLVVDDEEKVVTVIEKMLLSYDFEVKTTLHSETALALAKKTHFDFIITDQMMPSLSGTELIKRLRSENIMIPAILLTGHGFLIPENEFKANSIQTILTKPILINELMNKINQILNTTE